MLVTLAEHTSAIIGQNQNQKRHLNLDTWIALGQIHTEIIDWSVINIPIKIECHVLAIDTGKGINENQPV